MNGDTQSAQMVDGFGDAAVITINNQDRGTEFSAVAIEVARYDANSFVIAVYDATMSIVGTSATVDAGETYSDEVPLEETITETQTITVVLHDLDNGELSEPLEVNNIVVLDNATVGDVSFGEVR